MNPTNAQLRILQDFADPNYATRHTRSTHREWLDNQQWMTDAGWLARGNAREGLGHYLTAEGKKVLEECTTHAS